MYSPASFQVSDESTLRQFIDQNGFATLVTWRAGEPLASHLPLLLHGDAAPGGMLIGHMARANSQWRDVADNRALVIFHGPHAYISPTWYEARDVVPTWNYVAVHVTGTLRMVDDPLRLLEIVRRTVEHYESNRPSHWSMDQPDPVFVERLLELIVGFEVTIERLEGKWKLSQNHSVERRRKAIYALRATGLSDERQVADLMQATCPPSA